MQIPLISIRDIQKYTRYIVTSLITRSFHFQGRPKIYQSFIRATRVSNCYIPQKNDVLCACVRLILVLVWKKITSYVQYRATSKKKKKNRTPSTRTGSDTHAQRDTHAQQRACDNCGQRNRGCSSCLIDRVPHD